jgi:uncharacterized membrane protein YoaK (UPF0700 family)
VQRDQRIALALAAVAGFVDVVSYLTLDRLFTAHMTGNTSKLGVALARGDLAAALPLAIAPPLFGVGVAVGTLLADARRPAAAVGLQGVLIATFMVEAAKLGAGGHTSATFLTLEACATMALGLQTAALTRIGGVTVRTSYVTGVLTNLVQGLVRRARDGRRDHAMPLALLAAILAAYLAGATSSAFTLPRLHEWCLALPLAVIVVVADTMRRGS